VSGISYVVDVARPVGQRVTSIIWHGKELDLSKTGAAVDRLVDTGWCLQLHP
jgi:hypothetical protein